MKLNIYNNSNGWFYPIGNYKNKEEKPLFVNVNFSQNHCPEPTYQPEPNGKCKKTIFVNEASFNKYTNDKGDLKLSMTIFAYELLTNIDLEDTSKFGNTYDNIKADDLPFY